VATTTPQYVQLATHSTQPPFEAKGAGIAPGPFGRFRRSVARRKLIPGVTVYDAAAPSFFAAKIDTCQVNRVDCLPVVGDIMPLLSDVRLSIPPGKQGR
jgi:hypothetical protein